MAGTNQNKWSSGLFGCFDNCGLCIMNYIAPCYTIGTSAQQVGESCLMYGLLTVVPFGACYTILSLRSKIRQLKDLQGGTGGDVGQLICCGFCLLHQTTAEVWDGPPLVERQMARQ